MASLEVWRFVFDVALVLGGLALAADRWVHGAQRTDGDHARRLTDLETWRDRSHQRQNEAQTQMGRVETDVQLLRKDLVHAESERGHLYRDQQELWKAIEGIRSRPR